MQRRRSRKARSLAYPGAGKRHVNVVGLERALPGQLAPGKLGGETGGVPNALTLESGRKIPREIGIAAAGTINNARARLGGDAKNRALCQHHRAIRAESHDHVVGPLVREGSCCRARILDAAEGSRFGAVHP